MSACPPVCFQMRSWKTWWPIGQHIHQSLFHCFSYSESQQVHHFYSVFHSLPISDWPFEPCMGPVPLLSHAFFLPKFWLCSSAPLRTPQPLYSSIVASRKTFISHLFLQTPTHPPNTHGHTPPFFPSFLSFLPRLRKRQEGNADVGPTWAHSWFSLCFLSSVHSLSFSFIFFLSADPCGWSSCYITEWTHWHTEPHRGSCPSQQLHACLLSLSSFRSVDLVSKSVRL